jgi:signal transduction histidine kinase
MGYAIEKLALDFGTISDTVGELGAREGLSFAADEYHVFNQCIDTLTASALEQFSKLAHQQQERATAQRLGFIAHEQRNALASARMALAALKRGHVGLHSKTGDVLERGLSQLERLIGRMLLAAQLHGGTKPELKRALVQDLLRDIEAATVLERAITIGVSIEPEDTLEVDVDEQLIFSALSNLLQNAIKFTKSGGLVKLRARAEEGDIVIEVEDECGGLPPGKIEQLFDPYVQRGNDRRGLGLGLAITREAIDLQGGKLLARDLPGKGCVFVVRLPAPPQGSGTS